MKRFSILIIIFIYTTLSNSQNLIDKTIKTPNINPPNISSFEKFIEHPINLYNGIPDINIPLYNLNDGLINIPINLRYNTSGIKCNEEASWVGLGWNLNVGGFIIQNVVGGDDETWDNDGLNEKIFNNLYKKYGGHSNPLGYNYVSCVNRELYKLLRLNRLGITKPTRLSPDVYTIICPDFSARFYIDYWDNINFITKEQDAKIEITKKVIGNQESSIQEFKLTTNNGVIHTFNFHGRSYGPTGAREDTSSRTFTITKSEYPNGQYIVYNYKDIPLFSNSAPHQSQQIQITLSCNLANINGIMLYRNQEIDQEIKIAEPSLNSYYTLGKDYNLESVETLNYKIIFHTSSRKDIVINQEKLDYITIENKNIKGIQPKSIYFNYDYFASQNTTGTSSEWLLYRLKLNKVYMDISENGVYEFIYDEEKLPVKNLWYATDLWGYYNGVTTNKTLIPDHKDIIPFNSNIPNHSKLNLLSDRVLANRRANLQYCKAGMLEGIKYPTGGYTKFEYELNQFDTSEFPLKEGVGLRISSIKSYDSKMMTKLLQTTNYKYKSGILLDKPKFFRCFSVYGYFSDDRFYQYPSILKYIPEGDAYSFLEIYGDNIISDPYYGKSGVGYSFVTEIKKGVEDIGKTDYSFYNLIYDATGTYGHYYISDPLNGKLNCKEVYNQNGTCILKEKYNYKMQAKNNYLVFSVIDQIRRHSKIFTEHYSSFAWNYIGGYDGFWTFGLDSEETTYVEDRMKIVITDLTSYNIELNSKEVIQDGISIKEEYVYDNKTLQLKEKKLITNSVGELKYNYRYPNDFNCGIYRTMTDKNITSKVIEERIYRDDGYIGGRLTEYGYNDKETVIVPKKIHLSEVKSKLSNPDTFTCDKVNTNIYPFDNVVYLNYDLYGNPNYMIKDGSEKLIYLWSYGGQYPVAEIRAATYSQVEQILTKTSIDLLSKAFIPSYSDMKAINDLRVKLPHAYVTTYTYKPLVGMTSMTDPAGITTHYNYDDFGRLKESYIIEKGVKKVLQTYDYHYQNQ